MLAAKAARQSTNEVRLLPCCGNPGWATACCCVPTTSHQDRSSSLGRCSWWRQQHSASTSRRQPTTPSCTPLGKLGRSPMLRCALQARQACMHAEAHVGTVAQPVAAITVPGIKDDHLQHVVQGKTETVTQTVLREFAGLHHVLAEEAGVRVNLFQVPAIRVLLLCCFCRPAASTHHCYQAHGGSTIAEPHAACCSMQSRMARQMRCSPTTGSPRMLPARRAAV